VDVDSSESALAWARENRRRNGFDVSPEDFVEADVFQDLRRRCSAGEQWDLVVCDPPAFAKKKRDVDRAARGYKDVFRLAMSLVAPGGILLACSCSGHVSSDLFQKILFGAALDSRTTFSILEKAGAGPDHPVSIDCPETEYLKAFFLSKPG
jgi:23S rRNA (cytosine1962-C5)-methyltransferase